MKTKKLYIILGLAVITVCVVGYFNIFSKEELVTPLDPTPYNVTLSGTYTCLPHADTSGPQTMECAFGLKTDDGVYYAVNFGASGDSMQQFQSQKHITAEGFVVIKEALSTDQWVKYNIKGIFTVTKIIEPAPPEIKPTPAPFVGGQKIGDIKNFGSISIKPLSVEEDSRCPANVNCIWAGRVRVKILVNGSESVVTLGEAFPTQNVVVTLTEVLPQKTTATITPSDYRFTFTVTKKSTPITTGKCYVGGCSSQICSDKPGVISTCEYTESYACYKTAKCERQVSGQCGWTETASLMACLGK